MGDCGNCKGDCPSKGSEHSCGDDCKCSKSSYGRDPRKHQTDIKYYLRPLPMGVTPDDTPLSRNCKCNHKYRRYQCLPCIRSWVAAVTFEEVHAEIEHQQKMGRVVAVERLEAELKEKQKREIF